MAEQGTDRRYGRKRTGLLAGRGARRFATLGMMLLIAVSAVRAQDEPQDEHDGTLEIIFSSPTATVNVSWSVTFLVDCPDPRRVNVSPPVFPEELVLEEVRAEPRLVVNTAGERRTSIRFTFIPRAAGEILIGAFDLVMPERTLTAPEMTLVVSPAGRVERRRPYFIWEGGKNVFRSGEAGELVLRLMDWDETQPRPDNVFVEAPESVVLEARQPEALDVSRGVVLRLTLIPLADGEIHINRSHFQYEGYTLEIPPLTLNVLPAAPLDSSADSEPDDAAASSTDETALPLTLDIPRDIPSDFAAAPPSRFFSADTYTKTIRALWQEGKYTEALTFIRKKERDHTFGPAFVDARRELEQLAHLEPLHDERWIPKNLCAVLFAADALAAIVFALFAVSALKKRRASSFRKVCSAFVVCVLLLVPLALGFSGVLQPREAVLHAAAAHSVPDAAGVVQTRFSAGQNVFVRSVSGGWAFVESASSAVYGGAGWVRTSDMLEY